MVLAPLFEELICRGLVLESLRARYGVFVAWFGSSLFFGVMHIQPQLAVNAFFVGLVLAFLYLRTDSLWVAVLLHAFNNAIAYLLLRVSGGAVFVSELTGGGAVYYLKFMKKKPEAKGSTDLDDYDYGDDEDELEEDTDPDAEEDV